MSRRSSRRPSRPRSSPPQTVGRWLAFQFRRDAHSGEWVSALSGPLVTGFTRQLLGEPGGRRCEPGLTWRDRIWSGGVNPSGRVEIEFLTSGPQLASSLRRLACPWPGFPRSHFPSTASFPLIFSPAPCDRCVMEKTTINPKACVQQSPSCLESL